MFFVYILVISRYKIRINRIGTCHSKVKHGSKHKQDGEQPQPLSSKITKKGKDTTFILASNFELRMTICCDELIVMRLETCSYIKELTRRF